MDKSTGSRPFFRRFLLSYGLIIVFPIAASIGFYLKSVDFTYTEIQAADRSIISQAMQVIDTTLRDMRGVADFIQFDRHFNALSLTSEPLEGRFYYRMAKLVAQLRSHVLTRELLSMYFLYLPESRYVLSQGTAYHATFFFTHVFSYNSYAAEDWMDLLRRGPENGRLLPAATMMYEDEPLVGIPSIWTLSNEGTYRTTGVVVFVLDVGYLEDYLQKLLRSPESSVYVADAHGSLLFSMHGSAEEFETIDLDGLSPDRSFVGEKPHRRYIVHYTSPVSHLTFLALTPESYIAEKISFIRAIAVLLFAGAAIVSLGIAFAFSRQQSRPLFSMLNQLTDEASAGERDPHGNPFEYLSSGVTKIIESRSELNEVFHVQRDYLKQFTLSRIIRGEYTNRKEIARPDRVLDLDIDADAYVVFCVRLAGVPHTDDGPTIEDHLLSRISMEANLTSGDHSIRADQIDISESELAVLVRADDTAAAALRAESQRRVVEAVAELRSSYEILGFWGGSDVFTDVSDAHLHYKHAQEAAGYCSSSGTATGMFFDEMPSDNTQLTYPIELENRIMLLTKAGEHDALVRLLRFNHGRNERALYTEEKQRRYMELLKNTFYRLDLNGLPAYSTSCAQLRDLDDVDAFESILAAFSSVCERVDAEKKSHRSELRDSIIEYISVNSSDPNLGLQQVAGEFNLSTGYLSHFFKEQTGETFSAYVERRRIERAKALLKDPELTIKEVAGKVGYTNAHSFRRAFHKIVLQTPSDFRSGAA